MGVAPADRGHTVETGERHTKDSSGKMWLELSTTLGIEIAWL